MYKLKIIANMKNNWLIALFYINCIFFGMTGSVNGQHKALSQAPDNSFSIAVISDTQKYLGKGTKYQPEEETSNPIFDAQTRWIVDNIENQKIAFVSHAGDIVDVNNHEQWEKARELMDRLHGKVAYGFSPGNHDMTSSGNSILYQYYFPANRFKAFDWYGGYYKGDDLKPEFSGNNANSYQLFSAGGVDFVFLHLECNAPDAVLNWADTVLERYSDRFAVITTHMFLGPQNKPVEPEDYYDKAKGVMEWKKCHGQAGNTATQMWDKSFRKHKNLRLIFSGDQSRTNAINEAKKGDHGNTVHAFLNDYNAHQYGGLRIYRFFPEAKKLQVITYDAINNQLVESTKIVPDKRAHNFEVSIQFDQ